MNMILTFTIVFATLMLAVAVMNKMSSHRLNGELDDLKTRLAEAEKENQLLREEIMRITKKGGISETVLSIARDGRMENRVLLTFHISIYSLRDEVYLLKARQYIFSAKHICFC